MVSYYPDSLGPEFYNYGRPAYNLQKMRLMLDLELKKDKQGPILIDFHMGLLKGKDQLNFDIENYLPFNSDEDVRSFLNYLHQSKPHQRFYGIRYFGFYEDYLINFFNRNSSYPTYYNRGGEFYKEVTPSKNLQSSIKKQLDSKGTFTRNPIVENDFLQIIGSHLDRKFILVISPYHTSVYRSRMQVDEMWNYLKELQAGFTNIEILKFDDHSLSDDHFRDALHLNEKGAQLFSSQLKKELIALGVISPSK
jgi:hypothetical protein